MSRPYTLLQAAAQLGRWRYVELAAFGHLGRRAPAAGDAAAVFLASASRAHAWRAALFEERLPVATGLPDAETLTRSPGPFLDAALELLAAAADDAELLDALVGTLYPAMLGAWRERLEGASRAADGPVVVALQRAVADLERVRRQGLGTLTVLGGSPRPTALGARVGGLLDGGGGPFGPPGAGPAGASA